MNLVLGFLLYVTIDFLILSVPIFHKVDISFLDNLFISTSVISTTGLVTINIFESYNFFGQLIIMLLFQLGGIGYMTLTTYYLLFTTNKITHWHQKLIGVEFTLPKAIKINDFLKSVIVFTLIMEVLGSVCFFIAFVNEGMEIYKAIWYIIFHSVSSFCTAGFSLFDNSFVGYQDNVFINWIISVLAISGSLGFIVFTDLWYRITKKSTKLTFTSKIVISGFIILLAL
ncbi:potassium transporter TrkG [Aquimarina agarivorans]|uniref:potassium transporter TrkG n=1 Tax=Aquimarina agarivorans TaxID=980584 RepID=UPI000248FAAF|nr:potassium transporter TrkG [Aquimarina agarivorans]